jgi:hypothetical protein
MRELQSRLAARETETKIDFNALNNRVRCYAHIVNICSSHIIASLTSTPKRYLSDLDVPLDSDTATRCDSLDDSDDDSDDDDSDDDDPNDDDGDFNDVAKLVLPECYDDRGNPKLRRWFTGIQRDPLRRARNVVRLLRSSDQRKEGFRDFINDGNQRGWFIGKDKDGNRTTIHIPQLELLRDVKTRWDSVYMMLQRLRRLRPVS